MHLRQSNFHMFVFKRCIVENSAAVHRSVTNHERPSAPPQTAVGRSDWLRSSSVKQPYHRTYHASDANPEGALLPVVHESRPLSRLGKTRLLRRRARGKKATGETCETAFERKYMAKKQRRQLTSNLGV